MINLARNEEQHVFFLTYDFQIGFYKKIQVINTTKLYDHKKKAFVDYLGGDNPFLTSYKPQQKDVQKILDILSNDDYSITLKDKDMKWYKEVYHLYKENKNIILNEKEILYNFLILKCKLAGFKEEFSIRFIRHLFGLKKSENINLETTIDRLDGFIDGKKIWVPYSLYDDLNEENEILYRIVKQKQKETFNFNFNVSFSREYLELTQNSFIRHTYEYNRVPNFFHDTGKDLKEQYDILLKIYEFFIRQSLINIFQSNQRWARLAENNEYINTLVAHLKGTLELAMKAW